MAREKRKVASQFPSFPPCQYNAWSEEWKGYPHFTGAMADETGNRGTPPGPPRGPPPASAIAFGAAAIMMMQAARQEADLPEGEMGRIMVGRIMLGRQ